MQVEKTTKDKTDKFNYEDKYILNLVSLQFMSVFERLNYIMFSKDSQNRTFEILDACIYHTYHFS